MNKLVCGTFLCIWIARRFDTNAFSEYEFVPCKAEI